MAQLSFSPEADAYLSDLESKPVTARCAALLNTALDKLELSPGAENRRRRYQTLDLWGIVVRCPDDDLLILWGQHPSEADGIIVHYIGPDP